MSLVPGVAWKFWTASKLSPFLQRWQQKFRKWWHRWERWSLLLVIVLVFLLMMSINNNDDETSTAGAGVPPSDMKLLICSLPHQHQHQHQHQHHQQHEQHWKSMMLRRLMMFIMVEGCVRAIFALLKTSCLLPFYFKNFWANIQRTSNMRPTLTSLHFWHKTVGMNTASTALILLYL